MPASSRAAAKMALKLVSMDGEMLERHLVQAEEHVAQGERHIIRQHEIIAELARDGHGTAMATDFLAQIEGLQVAHVAHRDRLRKELAEASGG